MHAMCSNAAGDLLSYSLELAGDQNEEFQIPVVLHENLTCGNPFHWTVIDKIHISARIDVQG